MCESKGSLLFLPVLYAIPEECPHLPSVAGVLSGSVWSLLVSVCVCVCLLSSLPHLPHSQPFFCLWRGECCFLAQHKNIWKCLEMFGGHSFHLVSRSISQIKWPLRAFMFNSSTNSPSIAAGIYVYFSVIQRY